MSEFKQGQKVECSDVPWEVRNTPPPIRNYVIYYKGKDWVENPESPAILSSWKYIRAIKEPERIDYTFETFPRGVVYLREIGGRNADFPCGVVTDEGVVLDWGLKTYKNLSKHYEISIDNCETWQPCSQGVGK